MSSVDSPTTQRALLAASCVGTATLVFVGRGAPPVAFIVLVVVTFVSYGLLVAALSRGPKVGARVLVGAAAAVMVIAIAVPARSSRDVWAYVMYGRIVAQHRASPYTHVPADYPTDPALQRVQPAFRHTGSVYGPVFTAISAAGMAGCGSSPVCGRVFFQTLEALAVLAAAWIVLRATGSWAAAACVGLNPVLIASIVNGAHNDGIVAVGVLGAVLLARERPVVAGMLLGAVSLVKVNALLPAGVLVLWLLVRAGFRRAATVGVSTAVLVAGGYLATGARGALRPLQHTANFVSKHSFWFRVEHWITSALTGNSRSATQAASDAARLVPRLGWAFVVVLALGIAAGRVRDHGPEPVVAAALAVFLLASPYVLPWYAAPLVPLLAMRWRSKTTWVLLSYSALLFLAYPANLPAYPTLSGRLLPTTARTVLPVVEIVLLAGLVVTAWRPRVGRATARMVERP